MFYVAFIPPFIDPNGNLFLQFAILAGLTVLDRNNRPDLLCRHRFQGAQLWERRIRRNPYSRKLAAAVLVGAALISRMVEPYR